MAYTTQKDIIKVGFLNQTLDPTCLKKAGVALKSYASTTDVRAFDSRRPKQAQYLTDLVACRMYTGDQSLSAGDVEEGRVTSKSNDKGDYNDDDDFSEDILSKKPAIKISDTDSLLARTTQKLSDFENLLRENQKLKDELICSADELKNLKEENNKIKLILKNGDPSKIVEFEEKINELKKSGKINSYDAEELLKLRNQIGDRQKAIEVIEAENNALKQLTEKLSTRAKIPEITIENETSTDVKYLQQTVNNLKHEIGVLRAMEDEFTKTKINFASINKKYNSMTEQQKQDFITKDTDQIRAIIDERNKLRHQLDKMIGIEGKIAKLREKAMKADELEKELEELKNGSKFALESLQDCKQVIAENTALKKRLQNIEDNDNGNTYKKKIDEMNETIRDATCELQKAKDENCCLRRKLQSSASTIEDYEYQMHQLMCVINELRIAMMSKMQEMQAFDMSKQELISTSKTCLQQIRKELEIRCALEKELDEYKKDLFDLQKLYDRERQRNKRIFEPKSKSIDLSSLKMSIEDQHSPLYFYSEELEQSKEHLLDTIPESTSYFGSDTASERPISLSTAPSVASSVELSIKRQSTKISIQDIQKIKESSPKIEVSKIEKKLEPIHDLEMPVKQEESFEKTGVEQSKDEEISRPEERLIPKERSRHEEQSKYGEQLDHKERPEHEKRSEYKEIAKVSSEDLNRCKASLLKSEKKIYDLEKELNSCRLENDQLKEKNKLLGSKSDVIDELLELKNKLQAEQEKYKMKSREYENLKNKYEDLRGPKDVRLEYEEQQKYEERSEHEEIAKVLSEDLRRCKASLMETEKRIYDLEKELNSCKLENNQLMEKIILLENKPDITDELLELKNKLQTEQEKYKMKNREYENLKNKYEDLRRQFDEKLTELNVQREKANSKNLDCEDLKIELESHRKLLNEARDEILQCRKEINKYVEEVRYLKQQNEKCKLLNSKFEDQLNKKDNEMNKLQDKCSELEEKLNSAYEEDTKRMSECDKLKITLERAEKDLEKLQANVNDIELKNKRLEDIIAEKEQELSRLKKELKLDKIEKDEMRSDQSTQLEKLKAEKDRLNAEIFDRDDQIDKLNVSLSRKNADIKDLRAENEKLNEQLSKIKSELNGLEKEKNRLNELVNVKDIDISNLKAEKSKLNEQIGKLQTDLNNLKAERNRLIENVNNKDEEMREIRNQLEKAKGDIKNLKIELDACQKEKSKLAGLIGDIEKEREKNKNLQNMLDDFESKLNEVPKKLSTEGVDSTSTAVNNLQKAINKLKNQLENERDRNNELSNELKQCKDKLQMVIDQGKIEGPIKGSFDMEGIRLTVDKALDNLKREHMASLKKLQDMHEKQLQDLTVGHDKEIRALQTANEAMRSSLVNIRQKMESNICKCDRKSGFYDDSLLTKLQCICKKILDGGIECLSLAELTYLHTEVYKAGLKLRPELLKCENISNIPRCCKCAGFTCCLPSLPREKEKIFVERIVNLEKDVDNANKILQYLKIHCNNKAAKPSVPINNNKERQQLFQLFRPQLFRPNDEINKLLKKVSQDKICSSRRPVSKRK